MIKENKLITDDLNFKPVSSNFVSKQINKLNIKKARGYDGISPKILKRKGMDNWMGRSIVFVVVDTLRLFFF
jgi:hypothetical protein